MDRQVCLPRQGDRGHTESDPANRFVEVGMSTTALVVTIIVAVAFLFGRRRWGHRHGGSGEEVLGERYARGEITEQEYRQRIAVLREESR